MVISDCVMPVVTVALMWEQEESSIVWMKYGALSVTQCGLSVMRQLHATNSGSHVQVYPQYITAASSWVLNDIFFCVQELSHLLMVVLVREIPTLLSTLEVWLVLEMRPSLLTALLVVLLGVLMRRMLAFSVLTVRAYISEEDCLIIDYG